MIGHNMLPVHPNNIVFENLTNWSESHGEKKFFQGAFVGVYKTGKMPYPIFKVDYISLYPNVIRTFNISYETVRASFEPIEGEISDALETYDIRREGTDLIITYNDKIVHSRVTVTIDQSRRGLVPQMMDNILQGRAAVKKSMKGMKRN